MDSLQPLLDPSVAHGRKVFSILAFAHSPANYQLLRHRLKYAGPHRDIAKAPLADKSRMDGWETTKLTIGQAESLAIILPRSCNESFWVDVPVITSMGHIVSGLNFTNSVSVSIKCNQSFEISITKLPILQN